MRIGFVKLAREDKDSEKRDDEQESHTLRNLAMAGGMALPWAGTIGEKPFLHEGKGPLLEWEEFQKQMRPGDILIQGSPGSSLIKNYVGATTGRAAPYHAEVVAPGNTIFDATPGVGMKRGPGTIRLEDALAMMGISKQEFAEIKDPESRERILADARANLTPRDERLQILRPKLSPDERKEFLRNLEQGTRASDAYNKALAKQLAQSGGSAESVAARAAAGAGGTYNLRSSILAGLKELFVPKLKSEQAVEAEKAQTIASRKAFVENQGGQLDAAARAGVERLKRFEPLKKMPASKLLLQTHVAPTCIGAVCSSFPAQALPVGKNVVPGKGPSDILGPDWLKSELVEPIARYDPSPIPARHERLLRYAPTAARLGAGALLAGGIYGASKLFGGKKKAPPGEPEERQYDEGAKAASSLYR